MWRRFFILLTVLCCLCAAAQADMDLSGYSIASGNVSAVGFEDLLAPWSGTLLPYDLSVGDRVSAGDVLFRMRTEPLYAPESGTVGQVFVRPGDDAAAVMNRYGALLTLEGECPDRIQATTAAPNVKKENKVLHVGEKLFFRSDKTGREEGTGQVIAISGQSFLAEILTGEFEIGESFALYRSKSYTNSEKVGSGSVFRRDPVSIIGQGRVLEVIAQADSTVRAGDPLLTLAGPDAAPDASPDVPVAADGIVAQIVAVPGQQVWKGALLARIWRTDRLEVVADVDEMDLANLRVGDTCPVVLDMMPDTQLFGKVTEISGLGFTRQNAAYFQVHLSLERTDLPLGASASVYLPKK